MGTLGWTFGCIGGLCMVMGIAIALKIVKVAQVGGLDWMFWFVLSALLLLITIAFAVSVRSYD